MNIFDIFLFKEVFCNRITSVFFEKLIATLIGVGIPLLIFYLESNREREKIQKEKKENDNNTLNYFIALLKNVLKILLKQANNYKEYADNLKDQPFKTNLLKIVIAEDLNRILHALPHERIFHSYIGKFGNNQDRIEIFQKLFSRLNYVETIYKEGLRIKKHAEEVLFQKKLNYKDLTEEKIINYCANLINNARSSNLDLKNNPFFNLLNNAIISYYENRTKDDTIEYIQTNFIDPVKIAIIKNFFHIPEAIMIANNCRKATWLYNEILEETQRLGKNFEDASKYMETTYDELTELTKDLF